MISIAGTLGSGRGSCPPVASIAPALAAHKAALAVPVGCVAAAAAVATTDVAAPFGPVLEVVAPLPRGKLVFSLGLGTRQWTGKYRRGHKAGREKRDFDHGV